MSAAVAIAVSSIIIALVLYFVGRNITPEQERNFVTNFVNGFKAVIVEVRS